MDKYRPCPSMNAMFTSDSQHPPRSRHAVYLGAIYKFQTDDVSARLAKERYFIDVFSPKLNMFC